VETPERGRIVADRLTRYRLSSVDSPAEEAKTTLATVGFPILELVRPHFCAFPSKDSGAGLCNAFAQNGSNALQRSPKWFLYLTL